MKNSSTEQIAWEKLKAPPDTIELSLDRLIPGVDNIHYDVHLSPILCKSATIFIQHLIVDHAKAGDYPYKDYRPANEIKIRDEFRQHTLEVLSEAVYKAKQDRDIQINFLAQTALVKLILGEIRIQFAALIEHYKKQIRAADVGSRDGFTPVIRIKETISLLQKKKDQIISNVSNEIFDFLWDAQESELRKIREANFGPEAILPEHFFSNPLVYIDNAIDDFFMIRTYILLGNRLEDPLKYDALLALFEQFFSQFDFGEKEPSLDVEETEEAIIDEIEAPKKDSGANPASNTDKILNHKDNIDILFNYFKLEKKLKKKKRRSAPKEEIARTKTKIKACKKRLDLFYKFLKKHNTIPSIVADYEMQTLYMDYCPPLLPYEILLFLYSKKDRNTVIAKIKCLKSPSGKPLSVLPLKKLARDLTRAKKVKITDYLIRFLKDFSRYHRDLQNYRTLKSAMDWINLTTDEKTINLSRVNHTLYEFLLAKEKGFEEQPIVNHVIIKTDVRGSTDITYQIKERGLNPASYFSLNFFNPITAILEEYGATKVFIEGDAIILSIFEKEETPEGWYSIARACGLAINMLMITQRYNIDSKKHRFPVLEQGVGICYRNSPPTFLFDGENRIMISPAINRADRLSSCNKVLRKKLEEKKGPFNLFVFQTTLDDDLDRTTDDLMARYNVNGIELNQEGFEKLKEEIKLKRLTCRLPELWPEPFTIHTGIFPTLSGKYQRLVIREATIPVLSLDDMKILRQSGRKYYEVCTHRKLYEWAKLEVRQT